MRQGPRSASFVPCSAAAPSTAAGFRGHPLWDLYGMPLSMAALVLLTATHRPLRAEHALIGASFCALSWTSAATRHFGWAAFPFVIAGLLYDNFPLLHGYRGPTHVADLYWAEHALLSIDGQVLPHLLQHHTHAALDAIAGLAYALYLPAVLLVAVWLYFRDERAMRELAWSFLVVNIAGMLIWIAWPCAPPWYVSAHGLGPAELNPVPSAAGAARFDRLFGVSYFADFYARSSNVYGAMPSLHVAYPFMAALAAWRQGRALRIATASFAASVAFAAVYLNHHYVLDVLAGVALGGCTFAAVRWAAQDRSVASWS